MKEKKSYTPNEVLKVADTYATLFVALARQAMAVGEGDLSNIRKYTLDIRDCLQKYSKLPQNLRADQISISGKSAKVSIAELEVGINEELKLLDKEF